MRRAARSRVGSVLLPSGMSFLSESDTFGAFDDTEEIVHYQSTDKREEYTVVTRIDEGSWPPLFSRVSSFAGTWPTAPQENVHGYFGPLEIDLDFTEACNSTSRSRCDYSPTLRKLYIIRDQDVPIKVQLKDPRIAQLPPDTVVRMCLSYSDDPHTDKPIEICGLHTQQTHPKHMMRAASSKVTYDDSSPLPSLVVPLQPPGITEFLSFTCFSSCKSIKRRTMRLQVTLEAAGRAIAHNAVTVRTCAFPPRERRNDEAAAKGPAKAVSAAEDAAEDEATEAPPPPAEHMESTALTVASPVAPMPVVLAAEDSEQTYTVVVHGAATYNFVCHMLQGLEAHRVVTNPPPAAIEAQERPAKRLRFTADVQETASRNQVREWLRSLRMEEYADAFFQNGWVDTETVATMTTDDLRAAGVAKPGHLRKFELALRLVPPTSAIMATSSTSDASSSHTTTNNDDNDEANQVETLEVRHVERFERVRVLRKHRSFT